MMEYGYCDDFDAVACGKSDGEGAARLKIEEGAVIGGGWWVLGGGRRGERESTVYVYGRPFLRFCSDGRLKTREEEPVVSDRI
jgi:hypothetical protein